MRRTVAPCRLDELFVAEQQATGLGAAQELAAAIDHEIGAACEPRARPLDMLRGGIDHDRDALWLADRGDLLESHAGQMLLFTEQHDQRYRLLQRRVEIGAGLDLDDRTAAHPHRLI